MHWTPSVRKCMHVIVFTLHLSESPQTVWQTGWDVSAFLWLMFKLTNPSIAVPAVIVFVWCTPRKRAALLRQPSASCHLLMLRHAWVTNPVGSGIVVVFVMQNNKKKITQQHPVLCYFSCHCFLWEDGLYKIVLLCNWQLCFVVIPLLCFFAVLCQV